MHQVKLLADTAQDVIRVSLTLSWVAKMLELNAGIAGAVGGPSPNILSNISAHSCDQVSFECRTQAEFVSQPQIQQRCLLMHTSTIMIPFYLGFSGLFAAEQKKGESRG
jgi:hypothetical protein